jgi:hypothetical protein
MYAFIQFSPEISIVINPKEENSIQFNFQFNSIMFLASVRYIVILVKKRKKKKKKKKNIDNHIWIFATIVVIPPSF